MAPMAIDRAIPAAIGYDPRSDGMAAE